MYIFPSVIAKGLRDCVFLVKLPPVQHAGCPAWCVRGTVRWLIPNS